MSKLYVDEIASKTGAIDAMTIDNSGRILTPARPVFSVRGSVGSWVSVADGNEITIVLDTADINVGGHFNTSTYKFVAPIAGLYQIQAVTYVRNNGGTQSDSGSYGYTRIRKSGSAGSEATTTLSIHGYTNAPDNDQTHNHAGIFNLAVNDYITLHISCSGGGTSEYYGVYCSMSGYLIG